MRHLPLSLALACAAILGTACDRTAELIPGTATAPAAATATPTPTPTPTPIVVPTPIVPPEALAVAGDRPAVDAIPDAVFAASIVQIVAFDGEGDAQRPVRRGSGVVVDGERALILTSYPLVNPFRPDGAPAYTVLAVGHSAEPGDPVVLLYEAEIVAAEPDDDLAVLRAVSAYRGEPLEAAEFSAPAARFGNSAAIRAHDELRLIGYGVQGGVSTASVAPAELGGIRSEFGAESRAWFDLNARLPASMDGGGVFAAAGGLVGVLVQPHHDEAVTLGTARPAALAVPLIEKARSAEPSARYRAALQRSPPAVVSAGPAAPETVIRGPSFAENALDDRGRTVLFDYTRFPAAGLPALYYEFSAQGIPAGSQVEERWFLNDVLQDALSSTYIWTEGDFAVVTDRLIAPNPNGVPVGQWRLEVWVDGWLAAEGLAYVGIEPPRPAVSDLRLASTLTAGEAPGLPPGPGAARLYAVFEYEGAGGVLRMNWVVRHDGVPVHESPPSLWRGGDSGSWWVAHHAESPLGAGLWEVEVYFDGERAGLGGVYLSPGEPLAPDGEGGAEPPGSSRSPPAHSSPSA